MNAHKWHYNKNTLVNAFESVGIKEGDTVFSHVSLGRLGFPEEGRAEKDACSVLYEAFREVLGPSGTLLVPTYTYSLGRQELFDLDKSPSTIGPFTEFFRCQSGVIRSREPMLAVSGIGPRALPLFNNLPKTCYGPDSLYDRMMKERVKICTVGLGLYWATFRHHIEEMANVPFRFNKLMTGRINDNGTIATENWIYNAAPLTTNCQPNGIPLENIAKERGIVSSSFVGLSSIICVDSQEYFSLGMQELKKNPWLTAKGPALSLEDLEALEDERVGVPKDRAQILEPASMVQMIESMKNLPCDQISWGYDTALELIGTQIPLVIHRFFSGSDTPCGVIPEKWICYDTTLSSNDGIIIFSYKKNKRHVASYSLPFDGKISRKDLFNHLHVDPENTEKIPFVRLYEKRDWGLCCTQIQKDTLLDEFYYVKIKTAFSYGSLKIGEINVNENGDEKIVLIGSLSSGNDPDGLLPIIAGLDVMNDFLQKQNPKVSFKLLLLPDGGYNYWGKIVPGNDCGESNKILDLNILYQMARNDFHSFQNKMEIDDNTNQIMKNISVSGSPYSKQLTDELDDFQEEKLLLMKNLILQQIRHLIITGSL